MCLLGDCSFREAINAANAAPSHDTIQFAAGITRITLTIDREIEISNSGTLTIAGPGANVLTIDGGAGINRIFYTNFATATIAGVTLTGGGGFGPINSFAGGAIFARGGSLTLDGVHVTGNSAPHGSGGGALFIGEGSSHRIINSTFSGNTSSNCAGFRINDGTLSVVNSTISGNTATSIGGGLCNAGNTTLRNVTITNNTAAFGGGINQSYRSTNLANTIVAGNTATSRGIEIENEGGSVTSAGRNLIGDSAGNYGAITYHSTDIRDVDPRIGILEDNGGTTPTHALFTGSPAIDAIPVSDCKDATGVVIATDQRGSARPDGPGCDIGSYEGSIMPDLEAPALSLPSDFSVEATSASGATANYTASANDQVDGNVTVNCSPASGTAFSLGETTVNCSAIDQAGNSAAGSFQVTVVDTTKPVISNVPSAISSEAAGANGSVVTWEDPTATDSVSGNVAVTCSPASGSLFAIRTTEVICTATDQAGNSENASFSVSVIDTTAPTFANVPSNVSAVATSGAGAQVSYIQPTATDGVDGHVAVNCLPASGGTFPHGSTTVTCTATDNQGNANTSSFTVVVSNAPPTANPGGPYSVFEGGTVMLSGAGSDPEASPLNYAWDLDNDGSFETSGQNVSFSAAGLDGFAGSIRNVRLQVTDAVGLSTVSTVAVGISNVAPTITSVSGPTDPKAVNTVVSLSVNYTDPAGTLDGYTVTTEWGDGTVDTNATHAYTAAGVYRVKVSVADEDGGTSAQSTFEYVVIYDPSAGLLRAEDP